MDQLTVEVARYVQGMGVSIFRLAEKTELPYGAIYPSLKPYPTRKLRADEFMRICSFLDVNPDKFQEHAPPANPTA